MAEQMKGKATASLVLGILSIVLPWFGYSSIIALVCGIIGLVLANKVKKACAAANEQAPGTATGGKVTSIIGIVISGLCFVFIVLLATIFGVVLFAI